MITSEKLPQEPGWYQWYILDFNYLKVGVVEIVADNDYHLEFLNKNKDGRNTYYIYKNDKGVTLTMYHCAWDDLPPMQTSDNMPIVDGWFLFDLSQIK